MSTAESIGNQFGYICPKCKQGDDLSVVVQVWAKLFPDGTDADGDHEFDGPSSAKCGCGWGGKVSQLLRADDFED